jgi:hypothetical protein
MINIGGDDSLILEDYRTPIYDLGFSKEMIGFNTL